MEIKHKIILIVFFSFFIGNLDGQVGKIYAREIEVEITDWCDYVFNDDYKLMGLFELEEYINRNNHLPDVPSENEVIENGINLGEMDAILLKKIEELTLYVIDLKKENEILSKRIDELEKIINHENIAT